MADQSATFSGCMNLTRAWPGLDAMSIAPFTSASCGPNSDAFSPVRI